MSLIFFCLPDDHKAYYKYDTYELTVYEAVAKFSKGRRLTMGEVKTYVDTDKFVWMEVMFRTVSDAASEATLIRKYDGYLPPEIDKSLADFYEIGDYNFNIRKNLDDDHPAFYDYQNFEVNLYEAVPNAED